MIGLISNPSNTTIKHIRALRHRKEREQAGLFFVEGIRIVGEAVQLGAHIDSLIVAPDLLTSAFAQELVIAQRTHGIKCIEVTAAVFETLSAKEGPQGIGAVIHQRWEALGQVQLSNDLCWIALNAAQDPGNIGTILRSSDAVGGTGLILLGNSADPYDPGCVRASMGALFSQRLVKATFDQFVRWKDEHIYPVVGTSDAAATDYQAITYQPPLVLLMGSERQGLSVEQQAICDVMARIPMVGRSDSLNLAVATGVMLYEIFNQRRRAL